jgi:hypothetical protein
MTDAALKTLAKITGAEVPVEVATKKGTWKAGLTPLPYAEWRNHTLNAIMAEDTYMMIEHLRVLPKILTSLEGPGINGDFQYAVKIVMGETRRTVPMEIFNTLPHVVQDGILNKIHEIHQYDEAEKKS